jgi:hypothetical protein
MCPFVQSRFPFPESQPKENSVRVSPMALDIHRMTNKEIASMEWTLIPASFPRPALEKVVDFKKTIYDQVCVLRGQGPGFIANPTYGQLTEFCDDPLRLGFVDPLQFSCTDMFDISEIRLIIRKKLQRNTYNHLFPCLNDMMTRYPEMDIDMKKTFLSTMHTKVGLNRFNAFFRLTNTEVRCVHLTMWFLQKRGISFEIAQRIALNSQRKLKTKKLKSKKL